MVESIGETGQGNGSEKPTTYEYLIRIIFPTKKEPFQFKIKAVNDHTAMGVVIPIVTTLVPRIDGYEIWRLNPEVLVVSCGLQQVLAMIGEALNKFAPGGAPFPAFRLVKPSDTDKSLKEILSHPDKK